VTAAIVLAAGLGRRLAGATVLPKWLAPVNGSCPAAVHLSAFDAAAVERVHVVVPPLASEIEALVVPWRERLDIDLVANDHSADRNNWYSLLLGFRAWRLAGGDRTGVVVLNSDVYAPEPWFTDLLGALPRSGHPAALAIDPDRGRTDEAMKVGVDHAARTVAVIGKVGVDRPDGEYVGLAWWSSAGAEELAGVLEGFVDDPSRSDWWYEHGIQEHIADGGRYGAVPVPSGRWVEIDDEADLAEARALARTEPGDARSAGPR
jgi:choline kinase